jgi:aerobic carbon-monoxide dehydrogenase medium subunit
LRNLRECRVVETADEALELVRSHPGRAAYMGGGTHLALRGDSELVAVADLSRLGLDRIEPVTDGMRLGATLPLARLELDARCRSVCGGLLAAAAARTRTPAWRAQATLGGRLREADSCDLVTAALLVADARVEVQRAPRTRPALVGLGEARREDASSLFLWIEVPERPGWRYALEETALTRQDAPMVAIAAGLRVRDGRVQEARVAGVGLWPEPRRAAACEAALIGLAEDADDFVEAQRRLSAEIAPPEDFRATGEYRSHLAGVLLARALRHALAAVPAA